ncbi:TetR/AcrR family transcriptional regulator [Actinomadura spongiicola]|uniref:TetR/AcrR family transcriptional regulator n=1 Tax=Actinomadura spongiicola TaxID=2303421 RepID=A0A372G824_9ACTN|nr:TetR/AcrR family transcriptional regulator [Actinomadura spongiicola]RFS81233.1 TetR/AcrR family transcriptional regulator [Actinomadura spongiicola]
MPEKKTRRSPKPQERQRDAERTRRLILDAALAEFGAHGYAGARIAAIAARAKVNVQLISYYFDGKEGLYQAISRHWQERRGELAPPGTPLPEQLRLYALEALNNPDGVRLLAWNGLQYTGSSEGPGDGAEGPRRSIDEVRALQATGRLPAELDPACLVIAMMAAAMAPTTLPHIIHGITGADPRSAEFVGHYADQMALLARYLGLDPDQPPPS